LSLAPHVVFCDCDMERECRRVYQQQSAEAPGSESPQPPVPHSPTLIPDGTLIADAVIHTQNEPEQNSPLLWPILELHRHNDGYVVFSSKSGDDLVDRCAVRADELQTYFPQFRDQLAKNSFVGINADWRLARGKGPRGFPAHHTGNLRYLCACYVDLDYYRMGLDFGTAFGTVIDYQDQGKIPPASIIVRSGRGLWLLWLVHDPSNPGQAQRAFAEKIDLYLRIERAIVDRLCDLGSDAAARCAVRRVRIA
jgi:hypothetical protein